MDFQLSRRRFLAGGSAFAAATQMPFRSLFASAETPGIHFGYTAMTWGTEERQAIDDIAAVGFQGIQFRADAVKEFQPEQLRELLAQHQLTFVALSSGQVSIDPAGEQEQIALHAANAKFVHDAGGLYLQVMDELKGYSHSVTPDECTRLGRLLTKIGERTLDLGIPLGYHNHLNTISEHPENLDRVLAAADPKYVKLELDTAHSVAGGGDPAAEILKYHDRLLFVHLKDVVDTPMEGKAKYPYKFVELGRGRVDLPAVFKQLRNVQFHGWAVVELDRVPDKGRTAKESAMISKQYLEQKIGAKV